MSAKIVVIGAGSGSFGAGILCDAVNTPALRGSRLVLVDIDAAALEVMTRLARRMNAAADAGLRIEGAADRRRALRGADFVVISVDVDRLRTWRLDWEVPRRHGLHHTLGENAGVGGLFHALRTIPIVLDVCRDVEALCPQAWVLNFTNPVGRVCLAVHRALNVNIVGLCHGIGGQLANLGAILEVGDDLEALAGGINHFTWMTTLRRRSTGEDLYPALRERLRTYDPDFQPLCRAMFDRFGLYPSPGDDHIGEFLPYGWELCGEHGYPFDAARRRARARRRELTRMADGRAPVDELISRRSGERAFDIIGGMLTGSNHLELAVNLPNSGHLSNLAEGAIVEVPAVITRDGPCGLALGALPAGIAAICNAQLAVQELVIEVAETGSRETALQALAADPAVPSMVAAERALAELMRAHRRHLPQFA